MLQNGTSYFVAYLLYLYTFYSTILMDAAIFGHMTVPVIEHL